MIARCKYGGPKNACYKNIKVCDRWTKYQNFKEDMFGSWSDGLTLDRIDNTKNYSSENCRWVTKKEQANNTSRNRKLTLNGRTLNVSQWAEELNIKSTTIRQRIDYYGWTIEKALTTGVR